MYYYHIILFQLMKQILIMYHGKWLKSHFKLIPLIYDNQSNNGVFVKELNEKIDYKLLYILKTF